MFKIRLPTVKCVFVSYYFVVANCRNSGVNQFVANASKYNLKARLFNVDGYNFSTCQKRRKEPPWKIIYFGTDEFSLTCLQPINAKLNTGTLISSLGVVSQEKSPVFQYAESEKLEIHSWPPEDDIINKYDIGIVVSYGKLIPERIINGLPLGVLNVHGSLLPRWRGAAPIAYAIMNGDVETGVTIMRIKPHKFDVGDIVRQYRCSISPDEATPELTSRLAKHAGMLLMDCIRDLPRCLDMATPQPVEGVTYAPKLTGTECSIEWTKLNAKNVYDMHRAISHKFILSTTWFDKTVRLYDITVDDSEDSLSERKGSGCKLSTTSSHKSALDFLNNTSNKETNSRNKETNIGGDVFPGKISYDKRKQILRIQCSDGRWIRCKNLKVSTARIISPVDFFNGFLSKKDKKDWYFK